MTPSFRLSEFRRFERMFYVHFQGSHPLIPESQSVVVVEVVVVVVVVLVVVMVVVVVVVVMVV